jgi:ketosteroid isomerase-like protein
MAGLDPAILRPAGHARGSREKEEDMAGNGQTVIELDKKRMTAMAEKDIKTLNEIISDDLIYTHSSARLDTKKSLIGNMESGSTVYTSVVPSDVKAQDLGDTVVLTGVCRISVNAGGKANSFGVRFTDVYANKGGKWQMVTWQSTRTPD